MATGLSKEKIQTIIQKEGRDPENILSILIDIQFASPNGYVDQEVAQIVADEVGLTETRVYELLSYYAMLKVKPQAQYVLKVCNSSPCHFNDSESIANTLHEKLGVQIGETTTDGVFAYHYIPCVGACDIGPVIKIKDTVFGNLTEESIGNLLDDLRTGHKKV